MLFNSIDFALFLPIVFILYWTLSRRSVRIQNILVVVASYVFYGWWDWRFLSLIIFSTFLDYSVSLALKQEDRESRRKLLLCISVFCNLGLLGFFKYFNFFQDTFITAFSFFGKEIPSNSLNIILPVGISFYTFQTLSYTIDVYRRKLEPTRDFIAIAAFVSFFPQLVAGPIERATNLLPQFYTKRRFDYENAAHGLRLIAWGLFKKMVIADNCAEFANTIFTNSSQYSGSTLLLGTLFFAFQIYGDFSGYSDIAIGTSKLFGFTLMKNFAYPYFSRDVAEFWRRWHISLSTWFRDYVYIPLGGNRGTLWTRIRNTFIIFMVSGFWHGANWTFIAWGAVNALYFLPLMLTEKNRVNLDTVASNALLPSPKDFLRMCGTFFLTLLAWVFFRAESMSHALSYIAGIFSPSIFSAPKFPDSDKGMVTIGIILVFVLIEWIGRNRDYALSWITTIRHKPMRWIIYFGLLSIIYFMGNYGEKIEFIYFQF